MNATQSEVRLSRLIDERETTQKLHEDLLASVESRDEKSLTDPERAQVTMYRERVHTLDSEVSELAEAIEGHNKAVEQSKKIRRVLSGANGGIEGDGDGIAYRDFSAFARDFIITRQSEQCSQIAQLAGGEAEVKRAHERLQLLKRTPANTLSGDVPGLIPDQHIAQIFQVINKSRPIVASARQANLERGRLSFPKVTQRPVVAVQATQKTEAGNQKMIVGMEEATASTYLGGGDLSWQAINWSTPDALQLWFDLAAADYALKTEQDAAEVVEQAGFLNNIASTLGATPTYAQFVTAVAAGAGDVYANSGRMADTLYMAPDRFYYLAGLTSDVSSPFGLASNLSLVSQTGDGSTLRIVVSRGMDSGAMVVGDSSALICAETAGAPVELRAVEPAIGGLEVGIIGAFEAVVVEDEAFSLITTAS